MQSNSFFPNKLKVPTARGGFSLMETLVAVTVLLSAVVAVLTLSQKSLALSGISRNKIVAFYLAQEPLEYIHNVRDSNRLAGVPASGWLAGLGACALGPCIVDTATRTASPCVSGCPVLRRDSAGSGLYGYTPAWDASAYTRVVSIDEFSPAKEATVSILITWQEGTQAKTMEVRNHILSWGF